MRKFIVCCIGLLLSLAAVGAWAQEPTPNTRVGAAASVRLPVLGDLRGKTCDEARAELRKLHSALETCPIGRATGDYPANTINAQSLKPGTPASQLDGLRVTLEPAPAPAPAAVLPDLRGKTCDQAQAELRRLNVALTECRPGQTRTRYPVGTINAQSVAPGTPTSRVDGLRVTYEPGRAPDQSPQSAPEPAPAAADTNAGAAAAIAAALAEAIANANARKLPDLRGKTCEQALAELRPLRTALVECVPGRALGKYPTGTINAQSYAPGTPVSRVDGLRVRLEPFEPLPPQPPPESATVLPDVRGLSCDQARVMLRPLRIALAECLPGEARARYPAGTINAQSYAPGTLTSRVDGLRVRFEPAPPPQPPRLLPDLSGKTCDEAAAVLAAFDLRVASCTAGAAVDGVRPGRINWQSPNAGEVLPLAGPLVLRVQPAPMLIVPALIGLGETQATSALASRKLQARASGPAASKGRRVLSQSPPAGTAVEPGSAVEISLGLSVPRLLDLECAEARARAAEYGHTQIDCESRPATSPSETMGRVFEQTPPAGGAAIPAPAAIRVALWAAQPVTVPDVRERALGEAISTVETARLVAQPDQRQGERIVVQQSPAPGTVVDAGSAVRLDTREGVEVPDVVGQTLGAAQSKLRQSRLRETADAEDHADDRIVQSQAPAAHVRVAQGSAVQLSTKRLATVPDLGGRTCAGARAAVASDTFSLTCNEESSWRVTVFGTPQVVMQQPGARSRAEVGATIIAETRAPLPASAQWLGNVPFAAVAGVVIAPFLGFGLWLAWPRPVPPPVAPRGVEPVVPPFAPPLVLPLVPPLRAPSFEWRVAADNSPSVNLRWPSAAKAARRGSRHSVPEMTWRVVPDAGHVLLREFDVSSGADHADR